MICSIELQRPDQLFQPVFFLFDITGTSNKDPEFPKYLVRSHQPQRLATKPLKNQTLSLPKRKFEMQASDQGRTLGLSWKLSVDSKIRECILWRSRCLKEALRSIRAENSSPGIKPAL
jgi:hypothetical protein